jgi:breast cancer metastasis-suppressor 1-like protein
MKDISEEQADEYLQPLRELEESRQRRVQTSELQYSCKLQNIQNKHDEEVLSARQDCQELIQVTKQRMMDSLQEKIRRLHEEKVVAELTKENGSRKRKKASEFLLPEKRKKPVTVNGPCVIYMLRDMDIMEDLYDIRRGQAIQEVERRKLFKDWT